jgi:hypothetical protein
MIAILVTGCSESANSKPGFTPPVIGTGSTAKQGKPGAVKRKPKEMGSFTGPEAPVE